VSASLAEELSQKRRPAEVAASINWQLIAIGRRDKLGPEITPRLVDTSQIGVFALVHQNSFFRENAMNTNYKIAIALLAGAAIGGAAIEGLHAQASPKAYVVTEIEVINQQAQDAYIPKVGAVIKSSGGTYLARGGKIVALDGGEAPKRVTITVYDSLEKAQASRKTPEWMALSAERNKAIKAKSYAVEGVPN
jgi:uncharacterized protein (DUF1330 family)